MPRGGHFAPAEEPELLAPAISQRSLPVYEPARRLTGDAAAGLKSTLTKSARAKIIAASI
jgi:hypothetical protein